MRLNELRLYRSNPVSLATARNPSQAIPIRRHTFSSSHIQLDVHTMSDELGCVSVTALVLFNSVALLGAAAAASPPVFSWSFAITGRPRRAFIYINLSGRGVRLPEACQGSVPNAARTPGRNYGKVGGNNAISQRRRVADSGPLRRRIVRQNLAKTAGRPPSLTRTASGWKGRGASSGELRQVCVSRRYMVGFCRGGIVSAVSDCSESVRVCEILRTLEPGDTLSILRRRWCIHCLIYDIKPR